MAVLLKPVGLAVVQEGMVGAGATVTRGLRQHTSRTLRHGHPIRMSISPLPSLTTCQQER